MTNCFTVLKQDSTEEMVLAFIHSLDLVQVKYWPWVTPAMSTCLVCGCLGWMEMFQLEVCVNYDGLAMD